MKFSNRSVLCLLMSLAFSFALFAGGQKDSADSPGNEGESPLAVFTSILPQKYFVEKIGGDRVRTDVLVGPGKSPATYEPGPQQVEALASADILFTIGVPFEKAFLPTIEESLDSLEIVDSSEGVQKRDFHEKKASMKDPHIWISTRQVKIQAKNIYDALVRLDPEGESEYLDGYEELIKEMDDLDAELRAALAPYKGSTFFVFHPAFGYFADEYGLIQVAIETGGKEPGPSKLEEIIEMAKEQNVKIIFVQPEFSKSSANAIAEAIGGSVVMLSPLNPDYVNNLKSISNELQKAFE